MVDTGVHDAERLRELRELPLERKVLISQARIIEWYSKHDGKVYVSFSGGKDSTVLLDMVRNLFPEVPAAFVNTGLEFPEIREFALSHENVTEVTPVWGQNKFGKERGTHKTFVDVLTCYGYPIITKQVSQAIHEARGKPHGAKWKQVFEGYQRRDGGQSFYDFSRWKPLYPLPFRISDHCCNVSKKQPVKQYGKQAGRVPYVGSMAGESMQRYASWIRYGCNVFSDKSPSSRPLSFWTEQDVLQYIKRHDLPYCSVYGDIVEENGRLRCTGRDRTGCVFCGFGIHIQGKRGLTNFEMLKETHPKLYSYCLRGGQWIANPDYTEDPAPDAWNPEKLWVPKDGLGMAAVFDMVNEAMGSNIMHY